MFQVRGRFFHTLRGKTGHSPPRAPRGCRLPASAQQAPGCRPGPAAPGCWPAGGAGRSRSAPCAPASSYTAGAHQHRPTAAVGVPLRTPRSSRSKPTCSSSGAERLLWVPVPLLITALLCCQLRRVRRPHLAAIRQLGVDKTVEQQQLHAGRLRAQEIAALTHVQRERERATASSIARRAGA